MTTKGYIVHRNLLVGQMLKQYRVSRNITQTTMLLRLGWPSARLSRVETGKAYVTLCEVLLLCEGMGVSPSEFIGGLQAVEARIRQDGHTITAVHRKGENAIGHITESLVRHIQAVVRESVASMPKSGTREEPTNSPPPLDRPSMSATGPTKRGFPAHVGATDEQHGQERHYPHERRAGRGW